MTAPKRPQLHDTETSVLAAKQFLHHIGIPENNDEDFARIGSALSSRMAFDRADGLRDLGFDVSDDLLQDLINFDFSSNALEERVKSWVIDSGVRARRKNGDQVRVSHGGTKLDGEIVGVDEAHGKYTVYVESLGHVKMGLGTYGIVMDFEEIHPLARPSDEFTLEAAM